MIEPRQFLEVVRPPLAEADPQALAQAVREHWTPAEIASLLAQADPDVRRAAAVALGLVGDLDSVRPLAAALHDPDEKVNEMAEHSLWSIWFQAGAPVAADPFREAVAQLSEECYEQAIACFTRALTYDPGFAEAYNQRSIAQFLLGRWEPALADAKQALMRMPLHFGAAASMGHCHAHLGELEAALACYRRALNINPRMEGIARAIQRLETHAVVSAPSSASIASPPPSPRHPSA